MTLSQDYTVFSPDRWSGKINEFFKANLVAAKFFDDYSEDIEPGAASVYIPSMRESNTFAAASIATTSGELTATNLSDTKTQLSLGTWEGASFVMTKYDKARFAKNYNLQERYARDAAYACAKKLDTDILAQSSNIVDAVGDSATSILETSLEKAIGILESNSVPREEVAWFFHPKAYWNEVMRNSNLIDASKYGRAVLPNPPHNELFGIPVYITPQVPAGTAGTEGGHRNLLVHPSCIVYAVANGGPQIQEMPSEHLRTRVTADVLYGTTCLNPKRGVRIISKN